MRHEFRLADIGEGLEEAEIINWLVSVGDQVRRDQPLVEVMTDKSNAELPAPAEGTVVELGGAVGDMLLVGELIAVIDSRAADEEAAPRPDTHTTAANPPAGTSQAVATEEAAQAVVPAVQAWAPAVVDPPSTNATGGRVKAAPSTRRAAAERGIDLRQITGTGPGGRILLSDLDRAPSADPVLPSPTSAPVPAAPAASTSGPASTTPADSTSPPAPAAPAQTPLVINPTPTPPTISPPVDTTPPVGSSVDTTPSVVPSVDTTPSVVPLRGVRRAVARNMTQSWTEIPHIHAFQHIDAEPLLEVRRRLRDTGRAAYEPLTPLAFFVAAVSRALIEHPMANASIDMASETITNHGRVNVGIAVASDQGLVVPVLQAADQLDFETLSLTLAQLVRGAREGQLSREHFLGGTVTITNFGSLGGEQAAPLIRPPEAMILGFGSIAARPFVVDDTVVARKTMHLVAGADHRLLDGDTTTAVLTTIARLLSDPLELVI